MAISTPAEQVEARPKWRRKWQQGRCDDCGWIHSVTRITFWLNGSHMNVCADCIKPYRKVITRGEPN